MKNKAIQQLLCFLETQKFLSSVPFLLSSLLRFSGKRIHTFDFTLNHFWGVKSVLSISIDVRTIQIRLLRFFESIPSDKNMVSIGVTAILSGVVEHEKSRSFSLCFHRKLVKSYKRWKIVRLLSYHHLVLLSCIYQLKWNLYFVVFILDFVVLGCSQLISCCFR